jgi:hypothetical protein
MIAHLSGATRDGPGPSIAAISDSGEQRDGALDTLLDTR